eukprot:TRINITY_DN9452_c0_g1_i1.p1 TRINITY_DN9452_c0_g1~~TRINITY_DN9452_c0_g1_i1.p1  ORF type:complete len:470 (-),score=75.71 TRINITY_DN9452_c0_g1_i1:62-1471(-)
MANKMAIFAVLFVTGVVRSGSSRNEEKNLLTLINGSADPLLLQQALAKVDSKIAKSRQSTFNSNAMGFRARWTHRIKKIGSFLSRTHVKSWFTKTVSAVGGGLRKLIAFVGDTFKKTLLYILKTILKGEMVSTIITRAKFAFRGMKKRSIVGSLKFYWDILTQLASAAAIRSLITDAFGKIIATAQHLLGRNLSSASLAEVRNASAAGACSADMDDDEPSLLEYGVQDPVEHHPVTGSTSLLESEMIEEPGAAVAFAKELKETLQLLAKSKYRMLVVSSVLDLLSISTSALDLTPFLGQAAGVAWGPIQGMFIRSAFDGATVMAMLSSLEEMLPYTEVVPSCFISWLLSYNEFFPAGLMRKILHLPDRSARQCPEEVMKVVSSKYFIAKDEENGHVFVRCPDQLDNSSSQSSDDLVEVSLLQQKELESQTYLLSCRRTDCEEEMDLDGHCFLQCSGWSDCMVVKDLECP